MRKLLLRRCVPLTDHALCAVAMCAQLRAFEVVYVRLITDEGVSSVLAANRGTLRLLFISHCVRLDDGALRAITTYLRCVR